jgi:hypothetical protein
LAAVAGARSPQLIDQSVARDHLAAVQQQDRQQRPLPRAAEHERPLLLDHLERSQDAELEHDLQVLGPTLRPAPTDLQPPPTACPPAVGTVSPDPIATGDRRPGDSRMPSRTHPIKPTLALALALGAIAPAAASARPIELVGPTAQPYPQPSAQVVAVPAPSGFDWGDAGIGAAAGLGLSAVAVGGGLVIVGKRRDRAYATAR